MKAYDFADARAKALRALHYGYTDRARAWARVARRHWRYEQQQNPEQVEMGKRSQRKGRDAELADHKQWRACGFYVIDKRALEAAGAAVGVDYTVELSGQDFPQQLWIQRKHGKRPNCIAAYQEPAKAVRQGGAGGRAMPVAHVTRDYGPDLAILGWDDFVMLLEMRLRLGA